MGSILCLPFGIYYYGFLKGIALAVYMMISPIITIIAVWFISTPLRLLSKVIEQAFHEAGISMLKATKEIWMALGILLIISIVVTYLLDGFSGLFGIEAYVVSIFNKPLTLIGYSETWMTKIIGIYLIISAIGGPDLFEDFMQKEMRKN